MSTESKAKTASVQHSISTNNFKPFSAPGRQGGLSENQIAISTHSINVPSSVATRLGDKISVLFSDIDRAVAIQKDANGMYKFRTVGKNKSTKTFYAKALIEAKKLKKGRYTSTFDEKNQMLIARLS